LREVPLTYAGLSYMDRTHAIERGEVKPKGVNLNYVTFPSPADLFRRQARHAEFEASEMSASTFLMMVSRGDRRFVGIPVFVSRHFRHKHVYVNADSGIERPQDMAGKKIGVFEYQMTAALWVRAFLQHDYGVAPERIHWWTGGLYSPAYAERTEYSPPEGVRVDRVPSDSSLDGMLDSGFLDGLVTVEAPPSFRRGSGRVKRLFEDYEAVEQDYWQRTGLFPIMHLVVIRRDTYERHRWIALNLLEAFTEAKRVGYRRLWAGSSLAVSLPWLESELEEVEKLFGGDPFPYGMEKNRNTLEAMATYSYEQGLSSRKVEVEELFAPETLQESMRL
jgi:4,5-dihydroxyphthalate decarboxylase